MDARYINIGLPEDKVIEECAEVIQAITKIKRFGLMNYHPDRPESNNKIEVLAEITDLRNALDVYTETLNPQPEEFPKDKDPLTETNALYDALAALVHLHGCEQEGIESGMPTPEQWEQAVDNAVIALKGARREE